MSVVPRYGLVGDVDLDAAIAAAPLHIPTTEKSYETSKKKLREFLGLAAGAEVGAEYLTDHNIAAFILVLGEVELWKPLQESGPGVYRKSPQVR
jgi:hypothetical protein